MRPRWILGGLLAFASCFDPRYPPGLACEPGGTCPPGQMCDPDLLVCRPEGAAPVHALHQWSTSYGTPVHDSPAATAIDAAGNVVIAGEFLGTIDFGGGQVRESPSATEVDLYVARFAADGGALDWVVIGDDDDFNVARAVAVDDAGRVYLSGHGGGRIELGGESAEGSGVYLARLATDGSTDWLRRYASTGHSEGQALAIDADGRVILIGQFNNTLNFADNPLSYSGDGMGLFAAAFDGSGRHLWSAVLGGMTPPNLWINAIAIDASGDVLVAGEFGGTDLTLGTATLSPVGHQDVFLVKVSGADGAVRWATSFGSARYERPFGVAAGPQHRVIVSSFFCDELTIGDLTLTTAPDHCRGLLAGYDSGGTPLWARDLNASQSAQGGPLAVDAEGNVLVAGNFSDRLTLAGVMLVASGGVDAYLLSIDADGNDRWAKRLGALGFEEPVGLAMTTAGRIVVSGGFSGTTNLGGAALTSTTDDQWDVFVAAYEE